MIADPQAPTTQTRCAPTPSAPLTAEPLTLDPSRYATGPEIARGGLGRVVVATDLRLGRQVAIKASLRRDPESDQRIHDEASIMSRLEHPGIPVIYDLGWTPAGTPYFSMSLVRGYTLDRRMRAAPGDWEPLVAVVAEIADVAQHAHDLGHVHRDIKPSNIMLGRGGRALLVDWGIARALDDIAPLAPPAPSRSSSGTPGYCSPSQAGGGAACVLDDVYALGATLFRMVVGRAPRPRAAAAAGLADALTAAPRWLGDVILAAMRIGDAPAITSAAALARRLRAAG